MDCLIQFADFHHTLWLAELQGVIAIFDKDREFNDYKVRQTRTESTLFYARFPSADIARQVAGRCVLIKNMFQYVAEADTLEALIKEGSESRQKIITYAQHEINDIMPCDFGWKFIVYTMNKNLSLADKIEIINQFYFTDIGGSVNTVNPDVVLAVIGDYCKGDGDAKQIQRAYFARHLCEGVRHLANQFSLKQRRYIATTSMDAELSLIMANIGKCRSGSMVYDPFCGTGSVLVCCAQMGAFAMGSDLDMEVLIGWTKWMRQKRSKIIAEWQQQYEQSTASISNGGIYDVFAQYGLSHKLIGLFTNDMMKPTVQQTEIFDQIVTDPPYGIREGAKTYNQSNSIQSDQCSDPTSLASYKHLRLKKEDLSQYSMEQLYVDLTQFAAVTLKVGGRLVYWLPTTDDFTTDDIPVHECMRLLHGGQTLQKFGKWQRQLIILEKVVPCTDPQRIIVGSQQPSHATFREQYFKGFK
ncbi:hypothetical protein MIR68_001363 [Amoeboaphelidium protococcarum]|nr:hypothetical protein MIR68_001363 [Amoeboaphelidium protococcarum]